MIRDFEGALPDESEWALTIRKPDQEKKVRRGWTYAKLADNQQ